MTRLKPSSDLGLKVSGVRGTCDAVAAHLEASYFGLLMKPWCVKEAAVTMKHRLNLGGDG